MESARSERNLKKIPINRPTSLAVPDIINLDRCMLQAPKTWPPICAQTSGVHRIINQPTYLSQEQLHLVVSVVPW